MHVHARLAREVLACVLESLCACVVCLCACVHKRDRTRSRFLLYGDEGF